MGSTVLKQIQNRSVLQTDFLENQMLKNIQFHNDTNTNTKIASGTAWLTEDKDQRGLATSERS